MQKDHATSFTKPQANCLLTLLVQKLRSVTMITLILQGPPAGEAKNEPMQSVSFLCHGDLSTLEMNTEIRSTSCTQFAAQGAMTQMIGEN